MLVPLPVTVTVADELPVPEVAVRQRTPDAPLVKVLVMVPLLPVAEQVTPAADGTAPTPPEAKKVAHSLARPMASPTAAPAEAAARAPRKLGRATAERIPTIATTIISSMRVKP